MGKINRRLASVRGWRTRCLRELERYRRLYEHVKKEREGYKKSLLSALERESELAKRIKEIEREINIPGEIIQEKILIAKYKIKNKRRIDEIMDIDDPGSSIYRWRQGQIRFSDFGTEREWDNFNKWIEEVVKKIKIFPTIIGVNSNERRLGINCDFDEINIHIRLFSTIQKVWQTGQGDYILIYIDLRYYIPIVEVIGFD